MVWRSRRMWQKDRERVLLGKAATAHGPWEGSEGKATADGEDIEEDVADGA